MSNVYRKKVKVVRKHLKWMGMSDMFIQFAISTENKVNSYYKMASIKKVNYEVKRNK